MRKGAACVHAVRIDRESKVPAWKQVSDGIRSLVRAGTLRAGDRLPSLRSLAQSLSVSIDTVQAAYRELEAEGWIAAKRGSGFRVEEARFAAAAPAAAPTAKPAARPPRISSRAEAAREAVRFYRGRSRGSGPFSPYGRTMGDIADPEWLRITSSVSRSPWVASGSANPAGDPAFRKIIAERLREYRGIACSPEQIVVTSGLVGNLFTAASVLFEEGDAVGVETPAPSFFSRVLRFAGAVPVYLPTDGEGIRFGKDSDPAIRGVFAVPSAQLPLSVTMSPARRRELLAEAARRGAWVLEDGMEDFLWFEGQPLPPLFSEAGPGGPVVYMESFTLQFFAGIRTGFLVAPEGLADAFAGARLLCDRASGEEAQRSLCRFMESPAYDAYLRKAKRRFLANREALLESADEFTAFGRLQLPPCGVHATLFLSGIADAEAARAAAALGISTRALSSYDSGGAALNGLELGFGSGDPAAVRKACRILLSVLRKLAH